MPPIGQRFPIHTCLPELSAVFRQLELLNGRVVGAAFEARNGSVWQLQLARNPDAFAITYDSTQVPIVNFRHWPGEPAPASPPAYPRYWSAYGFISPEPGRGLGSAAYALARLSLGLDGCFIAPSETVTDDGKAFWNRIDPTVRWIADTARRAHYPDLTGRSAPPPYISTATPRKPPPAPA
jgi:hypothetical protein